MTNVPASSDALVVRPDSQHRCVIIRYQRLAFIEPDELRRRSVREDTLPPAETLEGVEAIARIVLSL